MAKEHALLIEVNWYVVFIVERFSSPLYPFDVRELLRQLPTIGYIVPEPVLRGTLEPNQPIARKGDVELIINQDNKTIGVKGREIGRTIEFFKELRKFYLEHLDPSPGLLTQYIEFHGEGWAKSGNNPTTTFSSFWANNENLTKLGTIIGMDAVNFGVQLVPPHQDPNSPEWFHIYLEPLVASASMRYHVVYICRGHDVEQLLDQFSQVKELVRGLIIKIEGK